ncbi:aspartate ammonia-lyase, partial [bacterium]|nr:aspartate ammonia-lyase [candidate division CSSED10-310 bacterium]
PVIPEAVAQAAMRVMAHDQAIAAACAAGSLELNPFLPLVADSLLDSLALLAGAASILRRHCITGLTAAEERCRRYVETATASATALVEVLGYDLAQEIATAAAAGSSVRQETVTRGLMTNEEFDRLISPERVTRLGSSAPAGGRDAPGRLDDDEAEKKP